MFKRLALLVYQTSSETLCCGSKRYTDSLPEQARQRQPDRRGLDEDESMAHLRRTYQIFINRDDLDMRLIL